MSEFTHENFPGCTDAELDVLNEALDALNAAEDYAGIPFEERDERTSENDRQNSEDLINALHDDFTVESLLHSVIALCKARGGSGEHAARALAARG